MNELQERIARVFETLESEYSIKECCGSFVGGCTPEEEPHCCTQPDLYIHADKTREAITLALLRAPEAAPGWQPIETAPKDRWILLGSTKRQSHATGQWNAHAHPPQWFKSNWRPYDKGSEPDVWAEIPKLPTSVDALTAAPNNLSVRRHD
jgi:hypothetical protein